jgi:uncharacterized protein involved in exopolysaccharide biosynthesis
MAQTTKLELTQLLTARNADLEAARLRIAQLEGDVAALQSRLLRDAPRPQPAARTRPTYTPTAEQLARRAAMDRARELAMATGTVVRATA